MGNYRYAMTQATQEMSNFLQQTETEQGDVSVGELTDLECGREEQNVEDCSPNQPAQRK